MAETKKRFRSKQLLIRLFDEEMNILKAKSESQGISMSDYVREVILYGEVKTTKQNILSDENFSKLLYELNRIGNNINQIAYNSNLKKSTGREEIMELSEKYDSLLQLYSDTFMFPDGEENYGDDEESSDN